jgi:hypothetical protein
MRVIVQVVIVAILLGGGVVVAAEEGPADPGWPRIHGADGHEMVVFQPQVEGWEDRALLELVAAIAVTPKGGETTYGVLRVKANTYANFRNRTVLCTDIVPSAGFPDLEEEKAAPLRDLALKLLPPRSSVVIDLDRILAGVERSKAEVKGVEVNLDPPPIFRSETPAILVIFMGNPRFEAVEGTGLEFAVNTNWDVFREADGSRYWLLHGESWITTTDPLKGPWVPVDDLPEGLSKLPDTDDWKDTRAHVPGKKAESAPTVFVSTKPAELIVTDGTPAYESITAATRLMAVTNTECDLFLHSGEGQFYYLVAGRWFRAKSLEGPWSAATLDLPVDFERIPADHARAHVRASVRGTPEANDAVILASIPRMAEVDREKAKVEVAYQGKPEFREIPGTKLAAAVNTPYDVIQAGDFYFCCYQGVWFTADAPGGPWAVCDEVPGEIYEIPPTSPKYPVTYVKVYDSSVDTVVVGQTSGYSGEYVAAGLLLFGIGMAAANDDGFWYFSTGHYGGPAGAYFSYGTGARYSHWHGGYRRPMHHYGPYGGMGRGAVYRPGKGTWARGAGVYGPRGGTVAARAYNPWAGSSAARNSALGRSKAMATGSRALPRAAGGRKDNVYVGRDGHVYRRGASGSWNRYQAGGWKKMDSPAAWEGTASRVGAQGTARSRSATSTRNQLNRSYANRQRANAASKRFGSRARVAGARGMGGGRRR